MSRLAQLWLFLRRPGQWSAERYRQTSAMAYTALHPDRWGVHRDGGGPEVGPPGEQTAPAAPAASPVPAAPPAPTAPAAPNAPTAEPVRSEAGPVARPLPGGASGPEGAR